MDLKAVKTGEQVRAREGRRSFGEGRRGHALVRKGGKICGKKTLPTIVPEAKRKKTKNKKKSNQW